MASGFAGRCVQLRFVANCDRVEAQIPMSCVHNDAGTRSKSLFLFGPLQGRSSDLLKKYQGLRICCLATEPPLLE